MTRRRSVVIWTLIALASLLALVSALTVWSKQQLLDTDKFTRLVGQAAGERPDPRDAVEPDRRSAQPAHRRPEPARRDAAAAREGRCAGDRSRDSELGRDR
jgi:hypothetical protein